MTQRSPKKLNILYVGTLPPHPGGSAISGSQLIDGLAGLGHSVRALAPITAKTLRNGDTFANNHPNINVTRFLLQYFESAPNIPPPIKYRRQERKEIQEKLPVMIVNSRPDIIFIGRETFAWHVPDIAKAHSVPCILRIAGATTNGILNHTFPDAVAQELLEQYGKANLMITPARQMTKILNRLGFTNVKTILNAIDLQQFSPRLKDEALLQDLAIRNDDIIVVHASNMKTLKRPLDLVKSAETALQQNPKLMYVIVGDGPLRTAMEQASINKGISERFRYVGWVDYDLMPSYINLADMVVMPSEAEGLARVYLETQACARLLLASDIPPAREVINNGKTGILFRMGDFDDLTRKTLVAASDPKLRSNIGRKAREYVQNHSIDDAIESYVDIIREVIHSHRASTSSS